MAIRIFESQDMMLARGFHVVDIPRYSNWMYEKDIDDWCQKYLQGEYDIRLNDSITGFFRSQADAMLFVLKWS